MQFQILLDLAKMWMRQGPNNNCSFFMYSLIYDTLFKNGSIAESCGVMLKEWSSCLPVSFMARTTASISPTRLFSFAGCEPELNASVYIRTLPHQVPGVSRLLKFTAFLSTVVDKNFPNQQYC